MARLKKYIPKLSEEETMQIVTEMAEIFSAGLSVDIIPHSWYKHLRRDSGLPHLPAIVILADVCFWWRPKIGEGRGGREPELTYIKKFAVDRLQRSRNWYEKTKGLSKKQVSEALKFLQAKGVIIVDYQDLTIVDSDGKERILYNRIYLTPVPAAITTITLLERSDSKTENKDWPLDETDLETKRGWSKKTRVREQESSNTETSDDSRAKIEAEFDSEIRGNKLIAAAMELKGEALKAVVKASISPTIFDAIVMACRIKLEAIHSTDRLEVLKAAQKIWRQGYGSAPKAKISFIQWWSDHKAKPTTGKRPKTPADVADHWGQYVQFLVDHDQYLSNPVEVDDDNLRVQFVAAKLAENFWDGEINYANYTKFMKELLVFDTLRRGGL